MNQTLWIFHICIAGTDGGDTIYVARGESVNLRCPDSSVSSWRKKTEGTPRDYDMIVESNCEVKPNYATLYAVSATAGGCELVVVNADKTHAGQYSCYNANSNVSGLISFTVLGNYHSQAALYLFNILAEGMVAFWELGILSLSNIVSTSTIYVLRNRTASLLPFGYRISGY